jgi:hypothetical protein
VEEWFEAHPEDPDGDVTFPDDFPRDTPVVATARQFRKPERENELLRITGYQVRLEGSFRAALRELRQLRKERAKWEEGEDDVQDRAEGLEGFDNEEEPVADEPLAASQTGRRWSSGDRGAARGADVDDCTGAAGASFVSRPMPEAPASVAEVTESIDDDRAPAAPGGAVDSVASCAVGSAKPQAAGTNEPTAAAPRPSPQPSADAPVSLDSLREGSPAPRANEPTGVVATVDPGRGNMTEETTKTP